MEEVMFKPPCSLSTPVFLLVFNRIDTTKQVFDAIRKAKPSKLYIASDGPREERHGESEKVGIVRNYVLDRIDWECEVNTLFREKNMGILHGIVDAISWFFNHEEMGIILEDDCLPSQSFFWFCQELLERYRFDQRIGLISGNNFQFCGQERECSYYFSIFNHIWGWASWRRVWKMYDIKLSAWPEVRDGKWLTNIFEKKRYRAHFDQMFQLAYESEIVTWDYRWFFSHCINHFLNILPSVNLVSNIGFGPEGTHCLSSKSPLANIPRSDLVFPLKHPQVMIQDRKADYYT